MIANRLERIGLGLLVCGLVGLSGCGDDGLGRRYSVTGNVTYKGQPVEKGEIHFSPADGKGRAATGTIEAGYYSLTTNNPGDGALPGKYRVGIVSREVDVDRAKQEVKVSRRKMTPAQQQRYAEENPQLVAVKALQKARHLIPSKYSSPETSGLTVEVEEESNRRDFDLKDD